MEDLNKTNELLEKIYKRLSPGHRFLSGLLQSLGATVGLAIFLAFIGYLLSRIELVPLIGGWLSDVANEAISNVNPPTLLK